MLMDDVVDITEDNHSDSNIAKIVKEELSFRLELIDKESLRLKVNKVCFFLDLNYLKYEL